MQHKKDTTNSRGNHNDNIPETNNNLNNFKQLNKLSLETKTLKLQNPLEREQGTPRA
jgi:hypothetical protein